MLEQTVSGFWLKGILASALSQGVEEAEILNKAGVAQLPSSANERMPLDATVKIWNAAIELTQDPLFGFHMGRQFRPTWFHLLYHLWSNSPTVGEGIELAFRYQSLISDGGELILHQASNIARIEYRPKAANLSFSYHQIDAVLTILVSLMRWSIDEQFKPISLHVSHEPSSEPKEYETFFDCDIEYNHQKCEILFDYSWLNKSFIGADQELLSVHQKLSDQKLAELGRSSLTAQITSKLSAFGHFQLLTKEDVAKQLNTSSRTLQRRLQQEGTSFQTISDELRKNMAEHYINQDFSSNELVTRLGFSEVSSLHKACKRWFGINLQQLRKTNE